jgi:hypothetical protein
LGIHFFRRPAESLLIPLIPLGAEVFLSQRILFGTLHILPEDLGGISERFSGPASRSISPASSSEM